jgi:D-alanyl-D-alanine dipeptidase
MPEHLKIPCIKELQKIDTCDNREPLINLQQCYPDLLCDYRRNESRVNAVLVRKGVAEKLYRVQESLKAHNSSMQLLVVEGYRHPMYQERYYLEQLLKTHNDHPSLDFDRLIELANQCVALPSVAGHPTGGAVDLTIVFEGKEVDMGCPIADFTDLEIMPTFSSKVNTHIAGNRRLLHDVMISENFAPFYGEWWHFSYGDREWAAFYGQAKSLYAPIFQNHL